MLWVSIGKKCHLVSSHCKHSTETQKMKNLSLLLSHFDRDVLFKKCKCEAPVWTMLSLLMNISANLLRLSEEYLPMGGSVTRSLLLVYPILAPNAYRASFVQAFMSIQFWQIKFMWNKSIKIFCEFARSTLDSELLERVLWIEGSSENVQDFLQKIIIHGKLRCLIRQKAPVKSMKKYITSKTNERKSQVKCQSSSSRWKGLFIVNLYSDPGYLCVCMMHLRKKKEKAQFAHRRKGWTLTSAFFFISRDDCHWILKGHWTEL